MQSARGALLLISMLLFAGCGAPAPAAVPPTVAVAQPTDAPLPTSPPVAPTAATDPTQPVPTTAPVPSLSGTILIDGSSTVFPIAEITVREFRTLEPDVQIPLGVSGTGGGFKKFCAGETAISNASRPINKNELETCRTNNITFVEVPIAFDGISVVVHPQNTAIQCMTVSELRTMWEPAAEGQILRWNQIRPEWPDAAFTLYGAGEDSGTYDYFTSAIVGVEGVSRQDFTGSEDDYILVQGVARNPDGLGFFGYAYYSEFPDQLQIVSIDNGQGCVTPTPETISTGTYQPLSRPLFVYINSMALDRPEVAEYIRFLLSNGPRFVEEARYIPLPERAYDLAQQRVDERKIGSVFSGGAQVGISIEELLVLEGQ